MATSVFWGKLREQFKDLQRIKLRARGSNDYVYSTFQTLIRRGATEIAPEIGRSASSNKLLWFWLGKLKQEGLPFRLDEPSDAPMTEEEFACDVERNTIEAICESSATYCARLEEKAALEEFDAKRRAKKKLARPLSAKTQTVHRHKRSLSKRTERFSAARTSIAAVWRKHPNDSQKEIVGFADSFKFEVPWLDCATWEQAFVTHEQAVKTLLSKAKKSL